MVSKRFQRGFKGGSANCQWSIAMSLRIRCSLVPLAQALLFNLILASWIANVDSSIPRSSTGTTAHHLEHTTDNEHSHHRPAWNASPQINEQGYLHELFRRIPGEWEPECAHTADPDSSKELNVPVAIRQVPGDGDCLFHAVAISLTLIQDGRHLRMDSPHCLKDLKCMSRRLRHIAVECLRSRRDHPSSRRPTFFRKATIRTSLSNNRNAKKFKHLFIQGKESMPTSQLLSTAAAQYGISSEEYCDLMEKDSYWGGGPEIVALCNVLKRPIHVYELVASEMDIEDKSEVHGKVQVPDHLVNKQFCLRRMATFGSPRYDSKEPLHILSADSRFPDVHPDCIIENGNHFMAIFPVDTMSRWAVKPSTEAVSKIFDRRRVRGGGSLSNEDADSVCTAVDLEEGSWLFHGEWFHDLKYSSSHNIKEGLEMEKEKDQRHSVKQIIGFWINIFVWTLSRFHVGF